MSESTEKAEKKHSPSNVGLSKLPAMKSPGHVHKYDTSNEKFAKEDNTFQQACTKAGVTPTTRQASKWRNKRGSAYLQGRI